MPYSGWSGDAQKELNALLGLSSSPYEQDWELEQAAPERCGEFVDVYMRLDSDDMRKALMSLILASYDHFLAANESPEGTWQRIESLLRRDYQLHKPLIRYWSLVDEPDYEGEFRITPLVKPLLTD